MGESLPMTPCEGSGTPTPHGLCQMCGAWTQTDGNGRMTQHDRYDVESDEGFDAAVKAWINVKGLTVAKRDSPRS